MRVFAETEIVAVGAYAGSKAPRSESNMGKYLRSVSHGTSNRLDSMTHLAQKLMTNDRTISLSMNPG